MYEWTGAKSSAPDFDQARADALVGKHILVGVTILSASGELLERSEYHGIIQSASPLRAGYVDRKPARHRPSRRRVQAGVNI